MTREVSTEEASEESRAPAEPLPTVQVKTEALPEEISPAESSEEPGLKESEIIREPVQSLEERDDDMLYEIEALHNMPFEQAVTMPFDSI